MDIIVFIIVSASIIIGFGSTLAFVVLLFGTMGYKIYRKVKYGLSLYD